ncbi:MAG: sulfotransferase [Alphaproteobacteria bacterium]|nr:sulfotransferase [Alphaproteobacteria bacterium]
MTHGAWLEIDTVTTTWSHAPARLEVLKPWPGQRLSGFGLALALRLVGSFVAPSSAQVRTTSGVVAPLTVDVTHDLAGRCCLDLEGEIALIDLPPTLLLWVEIVFSDGATQPVCVLRGRRSPALTPPHCRLMPVMMITLGRSGSTWLMQALTQHPSLVCGPYHPFENRIGQRSAQQAGTLARPEPGPPGRFAERCERAQQRTWACLAATESFYRRCAERAGKPYARMFVEKMAPNPQLIDQLDTLYGDCRVLILVRDFRDVLASILAFNAKRGSMDFGRSSVGSDEEYVGFLAGQADELVATWRRLANRAVLVRYEALMTDPHAVLRRTAAQLGLSTADAWQPDPGATTDDPPLMRDHRTTNTVADSINRWRRDLDPTVQQAAGQLLRPALAAFGYQTDP